MKTMIPMNKPSEPGEGGAGMNGTWIMVILLFLAIIVAGNLRKGTVFVDPVHPWSLEYYYSTQGKP